MSFVLSNGVLRVLRSSVKWCYTVKKRFVRSYGGFPPSLHALFIAERRAQSRHMNHSRRGIVRRWQANTIQQRDTALNCTKRSRNFGPPRAVAALAHELSARFLAQGNNRRGDRTTASQSGGQLFTERANQEKVMRANVSDRKDWFNIVAKIVCNCDLLYS